MILVREYKQEDYEQIVEILKEANLFDQTWDSKENISSMKVLVALENNEVLGVVYIINFGKKIGWIFRLAVRKDKRGRGVATSLIEKAEENLKKSGALEIGMYVNKDDEYLHDFYEKRGFKFSKTPYTYAWKNLGK